MTTLPGRSPLVVLSNALNSGQPQRLAMVSGAAALWVIFEVASSEVEIGFVETRRRESAVVVGDRIERTHDGIRTAAGPTVFTDVEVSANGLVTDFTVNGYRVSQAMQSFVGDGHRAITEHTQRLSLVVWPPTEIEQTDWRARNKKSSVNGRVGVTTGSCSHRVVWSRSFRRGGYVAGQFSFPPGSTADESIREAGGFVLRHEDDAFAFRATPWSREWSQGWPERLGSKPVVRHRGVILNAVTEFSDALDLLGAEAREAIIRQINDRLPARPSRDDLLLAIAVVFKRNGIR